ncbi:MAG: META domain-containing protein [Spongiibacteraceae bacterium]
MFRRLSIALAIIISTVIVGCVSEPQTNNITADTPQLSGSWRVEDIDQGGVIDFSMITIEFMPDGRIAGSTGCNRYSGDLEANHGSFVVSQTITTRRACLAAIGQQEQRFLAALNEANHYAMVEKTWLVIYDIADQPRLKLIQTPPTPQDIKIDQSSAQDLNFQCETIGDVGLRFLNIETIEVSIDKKFTTLQKIPTASGVQYASNNIKLWNKGNEALLSMNDHQYKCMTAPLSKSRPIMRF